MTSKPHILIIDDDNNFTTDLVLFLNEEYRCTIANSFKTGLQASKDGNYEAILLDIHLGSKKNGLDLLQNIRKDNRITPVIMVTRYDDIDIIVKAMKLGANDYLSKPINFKEFNLHLEKVLQEAGLKREILSLKEQLRKKEIPFFGGSPQIRKIRQTIIQVAATDAPVLITGETGVGKEIAARMIHKNSKRSLKPFHVINCSAIPENLIESELFGHEAGSFTGALKRQTGKFEQADGGTLLIDEIGELSPAIQAKLLSALERQEFYRLGGSESIRTDIRFLFATNADLAQKIKDKEFREDLFYRINVVRIEIPPLRERPEDIEQLVRFYIDLFSQVHGKEGLSISDEAIDYLKAQPWPGNIRQLKNVMERAVLFCRSAQIDIEDIEIQNIIEAATDFTHLDYNSAKRQALKEFQKDYIKTYLERSRGNISEAARLMNLPRPSLQRLIKELEITKG